jgi:retinol-binding protein 3
MWSASRKLNFGFEEVKRLGGDVGYLKVTGFPDAERGGPTVTAAMMFLTHTDALIIDLRRNRGGEPEMVDLLASYFFGAPPVHLNDLYLRKEGTTQHTLEQFWTLPYVRSLIYSRAGQS